MKVGRVINVNDEEKRKRAENIPWLETDEGKAWQKKWLELAQSYSQTASSGDSEGIDYE